MGLGCGGHSRLGLALGKSPENAERIVKDAIALGVNFVDTAESYGTEETVGRALVGVPRDSVVVSTKLSINENKQRSTPADFARRFEGTLERLAMDHVDILHLHGVAPADYPYARDVLHPAMLQLQRQGKLRHIGITEGFRGDTAHAMLINAVQNDAALWDVIMVGFNLLNPSARKTILPYTQKHGIGTLCMFAVRRALSQPAAARDLVADLVKSGEVSAGALDDERPLDFLTAAGAATSVTEAAYRFCLHEPGLDVILSGTGDPEHLRENAAFLSGPLLPTDVTDRLDRVFGEVDSVSGN